jgi:hypothetical protein
LKLAKENPPTPADQPAPELPKAPSHGRFLAWLDKAAQVLTQHGIRFENTLTGEEELILRQWVGARTWSDTLRAFHQLAKDAGNDCPDPCRLYFEKRDQYYQQEIADYAA